MYLLGLLGLLGLPRIRAFECSYPTILTALSSILMHPGILAAQSSTHARYFAPSSYYRASLSHTRRPCA